MKRKLLVILMVSPLAVYAQGVYKCTGPHGGVSYSNAPCVGATSAEVPLDRAPTYFPEDDYWSVTNQARRLEAQQAAERQERDRRRQDQATLRALEARTEAGPARAETLNSKTDQQRKLQAAQDTATPGPDGCPNGRGFRYVNGKRSCQTWNDQYNTPEHRLQRIEDKLDHMR
jgi:hypothetical protein